MLSSYSYANRTTSGTVKAGPGQIHSITLAAGGDAATAIIYDNTVASGTVIGKLAAPANSSESAILDVTFSAGCHVALTGTGPSFSISYG